MQGAHTTKGTIGHESTLAKEEAKKAGQKKDGKGGLRQSEKEKFRAKNSEKSAFASMSLRNKNDCVGKGQPGEGNGLAGEREELGVAAGSRGGTEKQEKKNSL